MHWLEALNCTFKYLLLTGSGQLQIYSSYLSLDFQLLSGSSYLFLARIVVVLASEFESYDAPLFRLSLIENECTCQGHAARIFQGMLVFHFGRLTCGLGAGRRRCWSVVAGALLLEHCCSHAFQLAFFFCFCFLVLIIVIVIMKVIVVLVLLGKMVLAWKILGLRVWLLLLLSFCVASAASAAMFQAIELWLMSASSQAVSQL